MYMVVYILEVWGCLDDRQIDAWMGIYILELFVILDEMRVECLAIARAEL
jgi:hypothetical protein